MNVYVVVEGKSEKIVYSKWIPHVNPRLHEVEHISDLTNDTFVIVQGGGMPQYFEVIEAAIDDINSVRNIDRLVICVDSEDMTYQEKLLEVSSFVQPLSCQARVHIVIQHFCFEAWALGNHRAMPVTVHSANLRKFKQHFDVSKRDPELLTPLPVSELNRAQSASSYLRALLNAKWPHIATYIKGRNAGPVAHESYLRNLQLRRERTNHIPSFAQFVNAFT
jgi:hypothetical protein